MKTEPTKLIERIRQELKKNMTPAEIEKVKDDSWKNFLLCNTKLPATLYRLHIYHKGKGLSTKKITSIENTLKYALGENPNVKVFIVVSTTSGKDAHRVKVNGRRRAVVQGTPVPTHVHIGAIGNDQGSAKSYIVDVGNRLRERGIRNKNYSIKNHKHALNYINYCQRQANSFHQYGKSDFNFRAYFFK